MKIPFEFTVKIVTGHIDVREKEQVELKDGSFMDIGNYRRVLSPGDDVTNEHDLIQRLAALHWTPELIAAAKIAKEQ